MDEEMALRRLLESRKMVDDTAAQWRNSLLVEQSEELIASSQLIYCESSLKSTSISISFFDHAASQVLHALLDFPTSWSWANACFTTCTNVLHRVDTMVVRDLSSLVTFQP